MCIHFEEPKVQNLNLIRKKTADSPKLRHILQSNWPLLFKKKKYQYHEIQRKS